jgi:hypothetical protein
MNLLSGRRMHINAHYGCPTLATFGTKCHLKPTCSFEENPTQTRGIELIPQEKIEN